MRKKVIAKGNMRRGDYLRALVTDTLPEEVPLIFSNDGFYKNLSEIDKRSNDCTDFFEALLEPEHHYTIPYRYSVLKDASSIRGLSLIHPSAQLSVARFYKNYDSLICHYVKKSPFSLRSPHKVGSTFFVKGGVSAINRYRYSSVDTVSIENAVSNPASYFSYNKYNRAHQFFDSNDYVHLEKKYPVFRMLDIGKCFNSLYTHTLYWAVADVTTAKDNTLSSGFANEFDRLMQSMNYNETNGICIGPEVSRVFAEIILSEVDRRVVQQLSERNLHARAHYEFRRYIDDFYIFSRDVETLDKVSATIQVELGKFNLYLNHQKTNTLLRPFATQKSRIVSDANKVLASFFEKFISYKSAKDGKFAYPLVIGRSNSLIRSVLNETKAICALHGTSYESLSDYMVSAISRRVIDVADGQELGSVLAGITPDDYVAAIALLLEVLYFFYTVNPTVRSSLQLARAVVIAAKLFKDKYPDRLPFLAESVVRWTLDLVRSISHSARHKDLTAVPVEVLNIIVPMREIADNEPLVDELVGTMCEGVGSFEYFEIVTLLFMLKGANRHRKLTMMLFMRAKQIVKESLGPRVDAQAAHLILDILSCPYLPLDKRASWFNILRSRCGIPKLSRPASQVAVKEMEDHPWFVHWDKVDLLRLLKKKELSAVY